MPTLPYLTDTSTQLSGTYTTSAAALDNYATSNYVNSFWTKVSGTNDIYNTSLTNGKVGIGLIPTSTFEIKAGGTFKIRWGSSQTSIAGANRSFCTVPFRFLAVPENNIITTFHDINNYDTPTISTIRVSFSTTGVYILNNLNVDGNIGFGISPSSTYKCDINGSLNSTSFYQNGTLIDFTSYATNANLTTNYYNKTDTNNLLAAKQPNLTAATTLLGTGGSITGINYNTLINKPTYTSPLSSNLSTNVISIDLSAYSTTATNDALLATKQPNLTAATNLLGIGSAITALDYTKITLNKPTNFQADWTSTIINKPTNFQADWNTTVINKPTYFPIDPAIYYNKTQTDSLLAAKEQILTFSSPLTRTTNTIGINLSSYSTTGTDPNFLKLAGGTMTGDLTGTTITGTKVNCSDATGVNVACLGRLLNIVGTNAVMRIWRDSGTNAPTMEFMSGPMTSGTSYTKLWDMGCGGTTDTNYFYIRDRKPPSTAEFRLFINDAGNTGIGTSSPVSKLDVRGTIYSQTSVIADITNIGATNNYQLRLSPPSTATQYAIIQSIYQSASLVYTPLILQASGGNVGIGNPSPMASLSIGSPDVVNSDGTITLSKNSGGGAIRNFKMGFDTNFNFCIGDFGSATTGNTWNSTQLTINYSNGNVGIGIANQTQKLYVNGTATINGALAVNGDLTVQDGYSIRFGSGGADGRIYRTGGQVYIEADDYIYFKSTFGGANAYFNQGTLYTPSALQSDGTLQIATTASIGGNTSIGGNINIAANCTAAKYYVVGETYGYNSNWNGTGKAGWFVHLNQWWYYGHAKLNVAIYAIGAGGGNAVCWFGTFLLSTNNSGTSPAPNGGVISIITDYKYPTSGAYTITITDTFDGSGNNVAWIQLQGSLFAGNIKVKIYG